MTTTYAGTSYRTKAEATRAAVYDWVTATGTETEAAAVDAIRTRGEYLAEELASLVARQEWYIPNVDDADDPQVAMELLLDFADEFGS